MFDATPKSETMYKLITKIGLLLAFMASCVYTNAQPYYPIKLVNNTNSGNNNVDSVFIIFTCQDYTTNAYHSVLQLNYDSVRKAQVASIVRIASTTNAGNYSYRLDKLQGYDAVSKSVKIFIPHLQSGRATISLNYPLSMYPVIANAADTDYSFVQPSTSNPSDNNYYRFFDKFEFSYTQNNTLYIDPTAVDFFCIPINIHDTKNQNSGAPLGINRDFIMSSIRRTFKSTSSHASWDSLFLKQFNDTTIVRVNSPSNTLFSPNYLSNGSFNYIDSLIKFYQNNSVVIDCSALRDSNGAVYKFYNYSDSVTPANNPGAYLFTGKINSRKKWVFKNNPSGGFRVMTDSSINMDSVTSWDFFGPGVSPFATVNYTVQSILVEKLTGAFTVGLLPAPNGQKLDSAYLQNTSAYYQPNKQLHNTTTGPWYNLYTQALHKVIPQIYAFAFDDLLGQSGTLTSSDNTDTVTITLGNMGNINVMPPTPYNVLPATLTYNSGFSKQVLNGDTVYVDTFHWTNPSSQPANAGYFFVPVGVGAPFNISTAQCINFLCQYKNCFYNTSDTQGVLIIPYDSLTSTDPAGIAFAISTCGGPGYPCIPDSLINGDYTHAPTSKPVRPKGYNCGVMQTATITYNSGFVTDATNTFYIDTVKWSSSSILNQSPCAKYMLLPAGNGSGFSDSLNTLIRYSLNHLSSATDTMGIFKIPISAWGTICPDSVYMQVYTIGNPGCDSASIASSGYNICGSGSTPQKPIKCCRETNSSCSTGDKPKKIKARKSKQVRKSGKS
jgi:hypothetical protein